MSCKLGEAKGSGQERLLIFFIGHITAHPLPNVIHMMGRWPMLPVMQHSPTKPSHAGLGATYEKGFWIRKLPRLG